MNLKQKLALKIYCLFKLPIIAYCRPKIKKVDDREVQLLIPLNRRTKNHFRTMYFGALSVGADFTGGLLVMNVIKKNNSKAKLLFKSFKADFVKRADSDVLFLCSDHKIAEAAVLENLNTGKRVNFEISVTATNNKGEVVANFMLTTSIR